MWSLMATKYASIGSGIEPVLMQPLRTQVDLVDFSGPDYLAVDKRCVALRLVEKGLCDAALFNPSG